MKKSSKLHPCSIIYIIFFIFFLSGIIVFFVSPAIDRNSDSNEGYIIAINYSWITIFFSLIIALITAAVCKIEALPFVLESPTRKKL